MKFETSIEVPTTTVDSWLKKQSIACVDMVWMDVQGAERNVLEGMLPTFRVLKRFKDDVLLENVRLVPQIAS